MTDSSNSASVAIGVSRWLTCIEASESSLTASTKQALDDALGKNADALFLLFENGKVDKVTDLVCCRLLSLYRTRERELCHYTMELVPAMIWSYLLALSSNLKKSACGIEACLLALYNLEVFDDKGRPKVIVTTIPSLGKSSIYHEPGSLGSQLLTESALSRYEQDDQKVITGPFPVIEKCNAKNRHAVLSHLLRCYNAVVGQLSSRSHQSICDVAIRVSCAGFFSTSVTGSASAVIGGNVSSQQQPLVSAIAVPLSTLGSRIAVSAELLIELARGVYFTLFNYDPAIGLEALRCLHFRAARELYADAIMIVRAMINSVESSLNSEATTAQARKAQHGLRDAGSSMGVSLLLTPALSLSSGVDASNRDSVITNASFRTQKLPDDIGVESSQQQLQQQPVANSNVPSLPLTEMAPLSEKKALGLSGLRFGPLKSALKKVERSISVRKDEAAAVKKDDKEAPTTSGAAASAAPGLVLSPASKEGKEKADARTPKKAAIASAKATPASAAEAQEPDGDAASSRGTVAGSGRSPAIVVGRSRSSRQGVPAASLSALDGSDGDSDDVVTGRTSDASVVSPNTSSDGTAAAPRSSQPSDRGGGGKIAMVVDVDNVQVHVSWNDDDDDEHRIAEDAHEDEAEEWGSPPEQLSANAELVNGDTAVTGGAVPPPRHLAPIARSSSQV